MDNQQAAIGGGRGGVCTMIRIMTYNICNAHGVNIAGEVQPQDVPAIAQVIREAGADIVGLNEVDLHTCRHGRDRDLAGELGAALGLQVAFGRAISMEGGGEYGNTLLSRWPMEKVTVTPVSLGTDDGEENRSVLTAEVATPEGRLRVMCTHLSWMHERLRGSAAKVLAGQLSGDLPTVLMGDFNTVPGTEPLQILTAVLRDNGAEDPGLRTFPSYAPERKIDYILSSPELRLVHVGTRRALASDHLPLLAVMTWSERESLSPEL